MCGFVGYIPSVSATQNHQLIIKAMADKIKHRGPDSDGYYVDDNVALGFRRLSIIDLSENGSQPFYSEDGQIVLVFNGEIYNFLALREELEMLGHKFVSKTDSEVVLRGYEAWGKKVLTRLRGMFGFAIWDGRKQMALIARDPFGIKPVYYGEASKDGTIFFGSEIKSFLVHPSFEKRLNKDALRPYLTLQYSLTEETFFEGIYKLMPGCYLEIRDGQMLKKRYYHFEYNAITRDKEAYLDMIKKVMNNSVEVHQISDVEVGTFLSGGIDSSYISALVKPENTFSVGFKDYDGVYDETEHAKRLSDILGFKHHRKLITADEFFDILPTVQYHMDEPQSNLSSVPLYFLAKLAKEHVTVVLSGEGADELFGGYESYVDTKNLRLYKKLPWAIRRRLYWLSKDKESSRWVDLFRRGGVKVEEYFVGEAKIFDDDKALAILKPPYKHGVSVGSLLRPLYRDLENKGDLDKKQSIDIMTWLHGDILLKADKMSSAHSLELRVPFLDKEVMKVAESLPESARVNNGVSKALLREAALSELPEEWAKRPKVGFPVPIRYWLREEKYYKRVKNVFTQSFVGEFFDQEKLIALLDDHYHEKANHQREIYTVYSFLLWYDQYFIKR